MEGIDGLRPVGCTRAWNPGTAVSQEDEEATPACPALALREFRQEQTSMSPDAPFVLVIADLTGGSSDQTPCPVPWRRIFASRQKPRPPKLGNHQASHAEPQQTRLNPFPLLPFTPPSDQVPNRTTPSRRLGAEDTGENWTTPMPCQAGNTRRPARADEASRCWGSSGIYGV